MCKDPENCTLFEGLLILLAILAILVTYFFTVFIFRCWFERRSLIKHGRTIQQRRSDAKLSDPDYVLANRDDDISMMASGFWPVSPLVMLWFSRPEIGQYLVSIKDRIANTIIYTGLKDKEEEFEEDSTQGVYR